MSFIYHHLLWINVFPLYVDYLQQSASFTSFLSFLLLLSYILLLSELETPQLIDIKWKWKSLSRVWLFVTPWTIQSLEFSRPEYWTGVAFPSQGDLTNPGIKPRSPALQVDSLSAEPQAKPNSRPADINLALNAQSSPKEIKK